MVQLWSSGSDFSSLFLPQQGAKQGQNKRSVHSVTSHRLVVFSSDFSFVFPSLSCLFSFSLQLVHKVLSSSRLSIVLALVLTPSRGIVACQSLSKTPHTRCSKKSQVAVCPSIQKRCSVPRRALHSLTVCLLRFKTLIYLIFSAVFFLFCV